jgi:hypothetical protein
MAQVSFEVELSPEELRDRLQRAFEAQEDLIRKRLPAGCRGMIEVGDRFWIQVPDPHRSNQWNDALKAAPRLWCRFERSGDGRSRISISAPRKRWSLGVLSVGGLAAAGLLSLLLWAGGILSGRGPVPGMRLTIGFTAGMLGCVLLGMVGAILWGRGDATPTRMAILRAVGLFGAGRAR